MIYLANSRDAIGFISPSVHVCVCVCMSVEVSKLELNSQLIPSQASYCA